MQQELNKLHSDRLEFTIIRDFEGVKAIRTVWEEMQSNQSYPAINADIDRYLSVLESQKDQDIKPYVILLQRRGLTEAMVIGRLERHPIELKLGYKTLLSPKLRCLTVVYGGILGQPSEAICALLINELMKMLYRREVDMVYFNHLRTESHIYQLSRKLPGILSRGYFPRIEPHWHNAVPASSEEFWTSMSASRKHYLRRYMQKLEKESSAAVSIVCYRDETDVDRFIRIASQISQSTYKKALCVGFADTVLSRKLITQAAQKGLWIAYVLYAGDKPCAFEYGTRCGNSYFPEHIAYDPAWKSCSPGTVLFLKVLEDLSKNSLIKRFDYGFGPAIYKHRFGAESWPEASVYIFAPRLYPVTINMLQSAVAGLSLGLNRLSDKAGFTKWLKRHWRNSLQVAKDNKHKTGADKS